MRAFVSLAIEIDYFSNRGKEQSDNLVRYEKHKETILLRERHNFSRS